MRFYSLYPWKRKSQIASEMRERSLRLLIRGIELSKKKKRKNTFLSISFSHWGAKK